MQLTIAAKPQLQTEQRQKFFLKKTCYTCFLHLEEDELSEQIKKETYRKQINYNKHFE